MADEEKDEAKSDPSESLNKELTVSELSILLNLTPRRIQQLAGEGVIPRADRGKYKLIPAVQGYIAFLQEAANDSSLSLTEERTNLTRSLSAKAAIDVAKAKGELIDAKAARELWERAVSACRSRLLSFPSRLAQTIGIKKYAPQIRKKGEEVVHEALLELSRITPADYEGDIEGLDDLRTSPDDDPLGVGGREILPKPGGRGRARKVGDK